MKYLLPLFFFLFIATEVSALTYKAACVGNRGKVSVAITSYKGRMYFRYANVDGAQEFPLYDGTVTRSAMVFIKLAEKELLSELDTQVQVSWPLENCEISDKDPRILECNGEARFDLPKETQLRSFSFFTTIVREEARTTTFESFKIRWSVQGQDFTHFIGMPFDPKHCGLEYIK